MSKKTVRLAILGTGGMANVHAERFNAIKDCAVVAAADVDLPRAEDFATKHNIGAAYSGIKELLRESKFDAVSIVTPDAFHAPLAIACLKAGKHVLCEKPLAVTYPDARRMVATAKKAGVINMVNLSYRDWPAIQAVASIVRDGEIGEVRHVEASYLQAWLASKVWGDWRTTPAWLWRLSEKHGSKGVLGDVGVHIVDFATFPVGPIASVFCRLKAFPKAPGNRIGEYVLDANDSAVLNVEFKNGALGTIHTTRWCGGHANRLFLKIAGTKGTVEIDSDRTTAGYRICSGAGLDKGEWRDVTVSEVPNNYQRFIKAIRTGKPDQPDFARGAEIQKVLDACFVSNAEGRPVRV
jgi:predicted dehydrogenase